MIVNGIIYVGGLVSSYASSAVIKGVILNNLDLDDLSKVGKLTVVAGVTVIGSYVGLKVGSHVMEQGQEFVKGIKDIRDVILNGNEENEVEES